MTGTIGTAPARSGAGSSDAGSSGAVSPGGSPGAPRSSARTADRADRPLDPGRGRPRLLLLIIGAVLSAAALVVAVAVGSGSAGIGGVLRTLQVSIVGGTIDADFASTYAVIRDLRLPRAVLAFSAGAALSVSGVLMQGLLRNPLVSPFTLGVSPAAAFGAALVITLAGTQYLPSWAVIAGAMVSSLAVSSLVLGIASSRRMSVATLLLLGIAFTQIFEALTSALQFTANENTLQAIVRWTFGSVNDATWSDALIVAAATLLALPIALWTARDLNAIAFAGDEAARSFGVNVGRVRVGLIALSVVLAAIVVSFCGIIGFVGLVGPHIARLIIGSDHRFLLPFSALAGGVLLLIADVVGRTVIAPAVVPVGIVVAFIGGPLFVYLIITRRNSLK